MRAAAGTASTHFQGRPSPCPNGQNRQRGIMLISESKDFVTHHSKDVVQLGLEATQFTCHI